MDRRSEVRCEKGADCGTVTWRRREADKERTVNKKKEETAMQNQGSRGRPINAEKMKKLAEMEKNTKKLQEELIGEKSG